MVTIRLTSSGPRAGNGSPGSWRTYSGAMISSATAKLPWLHSSSLHRRAIALFCSTVIFGLLFSDTPTPLLRHINHVDKTIVNTSAEPGIYLDQEHFGMCLH